MRPLRVRLLQDGWPLFAGVVLMGVSCALLKSPPDLGATSDIDDVYDVGAFDEPNGTVTEGGTLSGQWQGSCDIYGYPYTVDLDISDGGGEITGTGTFDLGWSSFDGEVSGSRTADGVQMDLSLDYYGYPIYLTMDAEFTDGVTLEGDCQYRYGSTGFLQLERL